MPGLDTFPKKPCKFCNQMGHFPYQCRVNPKVMLKRKVGKKRTPLKRIGKHTKQWYITRATWIKNNPADDEGYWDCYLQIHPWCPKRLTIDTLTLDHVVARSRDPSKRFSADNLRPACTYCNEMKGSRSLDELKR